MLLMKLHLQAKWANNKSSAAAGVTLGHCERRWLNVTPTLAQRPIFDGVWANVTLRFSLATKIRYSHGKWVVIKYDLHVH